MNGGVDLRNLNRRELLGCLGLAAVGNTTWQAGELLIKSGLVTTSAPFALGHQDKSNPSTLPIITERRYAAPLDLRRLDHQVMVHKFNASFNSHAPVLWPWRSPDDRLLILKVFGPLLGNPGENRILEQGADHEPFPKTFDYEGSRNRSFKIVSQDHSLICSFVFPEQFSIRYDTTGHGLRATIDPAPIVLVDTDGAERCTSVPRNQRLKSALISRHQASYTLICSLFPQWRTIVTSDSSTDIHGA